MYCFSAGEAGAVGDGEEGGGGGGFFGEEDAGFFEELADRADAVRGAVEMAVDVGGRGGERAVGGVEIAAWEDVGGGEGGGCFAPMEEEDVVGGGDENDGCRG